MARAPSASGEAEGAGDAVAAGVVTVDAATGPEDADGVLLMASPWWQATSNHKHGSVENRGNDGSMGPQDPQNVQTFGRPSHFAFEGGRGQQVLGIGGFNNQIEKEMGKEKGLWF